MSSTADTTAPQDNIPLAERESAIKHWTRQTLALSDEFIVTVGEYDCKKPTCPNRRTVIMVMSENGPTRQMSLHKSIKDVGELDVLDAYMEMLREQPA